MHGIFRLQFVRQATQVSHTVYWHDLACEGDDGLREALCDLGRDHRSRTIDEDCPGAQERGKAMALRSRDHLIGESGAGFWIGEGNRLEAIERCGEIIKAGYGHGGAGLRDPHATGADRQFEMCCCAGQAIGLCLRQHGGDNDTRLEVEAIGKDLARATRRGIGEFKGRAAGFDKFWRQPVHGSPEAARAQNFKLSRHVGPP